MSDPLDALRQHVDACAGIAGDASLTDTTALTDDAVVALLPALQAVVQRAQGMLALVAGEAHARSTGKDGLLARTLGERSARALLASRTGMSFGQAAKLVAVGEAIRPRTTRSGLPRPADLPHVAGAVLDGSLSVDRAGMIDQTLQALSTRIPEQLADALEGAMVEQATSTTCSFAQFARSCRNLVDSFDPAGSQGRGDELRAKASIRETKLGNGLLRIVAELDPEAAAFYLAAIRARTNPRRDAADGPEEGSETPADRTADRPTPMQAKLDAFTRIMRDSLKADSGDQAGVDTTILVRIDHAALTSGVGSATIDGVDAPISAAAARRLAVDADLIPQVMGGRSQLLDQGVARRIFTKAQRYAILARYTGCTFPGCDIPSSMSEIHHIGRWATRSEHRHGTDLANGLLLCGFHNRMMEAGWDASTDADGVPWFTPPPRVDRRQKPIRGGNVVHRAA